jgi:iron-sulfur cluster insertion protein
MASQEAGLIGQGLRVQVVGGGCAGFSYELVFEEKPKPNDKVFELHGVTLYIDPFSYQYLEGTEVDYVVTDHGGGFKFKNPNVKTTCGCGSSFSS